MELTFFLPLIGCLFGWFGSRIYYKKKWEVG